MNILATTIQKSVKFLSKQADDIARYGKNNVERVNVTDEMLNTFTPFRRLSQKPCTLSDPKHFIAKFEGEMGQDFLPLNWSKLSEAQKVDYIVRDRYSKLVSHKIMNEIKHEPIEHGFALNPKGDIVHYSGGNTTHCSIRVPENGISIHNHPGSTQILDSDEIELLQKYRPASLHAVPQGGEDLMEGFKLGERAGYVVDSLGNKFVVEPSTKVLEKGVLERMQHIGRLTGDMNKADMLTLMVHNNRATEQGKLVDSIYEEAMNYSKLKGTPQYNDERWLQYRVDFTEAKYNQRYLDLSWREEFLTEAGDIFGFRFKRIGRVQ